MSGRLSLSLRAAKIELQGTVRHLSLECERDYPNSRRITALKNTIAKLKVDIIELERRIAVQQHKEHEEHEED